jgi:hypothetical protein
MATIRGGTKFENALAVLAAKLAKPRTLRVGFLEGATYPNGKSVALIAAIQNFGAPRANIPPRPFFSNMVAKKSPQWPSGLARQLKATGNDVDAALALTGEAIRGQLQQEIRETNAPPLSPVTIARKGFDKPLIHTSNMINSVAYEIRR